MTEPQVSAGVISERAVVGAALYSTDMAAKLVDRVPIEHFTDPLCRAIWQCMADQAAFNEYLDLQAVVGLMTTQPQWRDATARIFDLAAQAAPAGVNYHIEQLVQAAQLAMVARVGQRLLQASEPGADADELVASARAQLEALEATSSGGTGITMEQLIPRVLEVAETDTTDQIIPSGYGILDDLVTMRPGQLVVVGARPGVGKSTLGFDIARHAAARGDHVVICSLEMTHEEVGAKLLAAQAAIPFKAIMDGTMNEIQWQHAAAAMPKLASYPITVDDTPTMTLANIRSWARKARPRIIVVDYLQLIAAPKTDSREQAIAAISRTLKIIAKEARCLVIALAQLNRSLKDRKDKRPTMTDLRESGSIEADADTIILLHREEADDDKGSRVFEVEELIVAKQRGGPTGTVDLGFDGPHSRFVELALGYQDQAPVAPTWSPTAAIDLYDNDRDDD